jgi:PAS domain S-box-containing protein
MTDRSQQDLDALPLLEAMTESVLVTTTELDRPGPLIVYVNPAFERMTGWPRDEVLGQSPRILQGPKTDHGIFRDLRERLDRGEAWLGQTINYRKDGSEFVMEWSIVPIRNARGRRKWFQQVEDTNRKLIQMNTEQQETLDLFVKYVPETVVEKGLKARGGSLFRGEQLDVVALFCDMRDFTPLSERLAPDAVVELLNTYYTMMAKVIAAHEGVVNQFVGDEIFAVFGAPLPIRDCVGSAVRCAVAMVQRLEAINARVRTAIGQEIRVGIGLNYGPVIAGNLGSRDRISYSVTGDTVNTAKRIEALAKTGTNTMVTTRPWPAIPLKGKEAEVKVYEVLGLRGARHDGTGRERG